MELFPSCPNPLEPQHWIVPSASTSQVCPPPAETARILMGPDAPPAPSAPPTPVVPPPPNTPPEPVAPPVVVTPPVPEAPPLAAPPPLPVLPPPLGAPPVAVPPPAPGPSPVLPPDPGRDGAPPVQAPKESATSAPEASRRSPDTLRNDILESLSGAYQAPWHTSPSASAVIRGVKATFVFLSGAIATRRIPPPPGPVCHVGGSPCGAGL